MASSLFALTGATGHIGRALTERLLEAGHRVRAVARHADSLQALADRGAEVHTGSVGDRTFLAQVLTGVDGVFLMVPPDYTSNDMLERQRAVVDAEIGALRDAGVRRVVALSSVGADRAKGTGPIVTLHNFENELEALEGVDVRVLRAAFFMENHLQNIDLIKHMGINGSAARPDVPIASVATRDIAAVAADELTSSSFRGFSVRYVLGPRDMTFAEATRVLGQAIGRPDLPYVQFSYEDMEKALTGAGLPPAVAGILVEMYEGVNEGRLTPTQPRSAENTTPTSLEQFSKTFADAYKGSTKAASA